MPRKIRKENQNLTKLCLGVYKKMSDYLQDKLETIYETFLSSSYYWRWRLKQLIRDSTFRYMIPVFIFYIIAYYFLSPIRLFRKSPLQKSSSPLFLHFFSGILLLSASGLAVGLSSKGNPAAFGYGAAGGASLFLSLYTLGDHRPIQTVLRSLPLLLVFTACAIDAFKIPYYRVNQLLFKKGDYKSAIDAIIVAFVPPMPPDWDGFAGSSYPPLQFIAGYTWIVFLFVLILSFFIALPLRFKRFFPLGGPFSKSFFSGVSLVAVVVLLMSIFHEIVRTRQQATLDDIETDKRRKVADLHFYVCAGYAVSALLVWAREASLSRLQLVTSTAIRGASIDLYALVALGLLIASVLFKIPTSLNDRLTRLHQVRTLIFDAVKGSATLMMKDANNFHGRLFGGGHLPRPGDGSIGAGIVLLIFSEFLIDALSWSSLLFSPLISEVTSRANPRLCKAFLTLDFSSDELVSNSFSSKISSLLQDLQKMNAKATFFLTTEGFQELASNTSLLSEIVNQGIELGLLLGCGESGHGSSSTIEEEIIHAESIANDVLKRVSSTIQKRTKSKSSSAAITNVTSTTTQVQETIRWVRPRDGSNSSHFLSAITSCGLSVALWSSSVNCLSTQVGVDGASLATLPRQLGLIQSHSFISTDPAALESSSVKGAIVRIQNVTSEGIKGIIDVLRKKENEIIFDTLKDV
jgi:hypothetical protein